MAKFAHIELNMQLGIIHLEYPRCIMWYGSGFGDEHYEWLDAAPIKLRPEIIHALEKKTLELQWEGTKDFPYLYYTDLFKKDDEDWLTMLSKDIDYMLLVFNFMMDFSHI